ncbi:hypothetical protein [Methanogenium cariaci]
MLQRFPEDITEASPPASLLCADVIHSPACLSLFPIFASPTGFENG